MKFMVLKYPNLLDPIVAFYITSLSQMASRENQNLNTSSNNEQINQNDDDNNNNKKNMNNNNNMNNGNNNINNLKRISNKPHKESVSEFFARSATPIHYNYHYHHQKQQIHGHHSHHQHQQQKNHLRSRVSSASPFSSRNIQSIKQSLKNKF